MARPRWHGDDLDAAMAKAGDPASMGVCLSALESRVRPFVDSQIEEMTDPELLKDTEAMLAERMNGPVEEGMASLIQARSVIGGSFTFGIAVGLMLAADKETDQ